MLDTPKKEIKLFYCYAHEDKAFRDELETHLSALKRQYHLINWHDREILPGENWEQAIDKHLRTADLILLLISPHFMASDYCYGKEMTKALERHQAGTCRVIPILIRPVYWENTPFGSIQMLPTNARPIMIWLNRDEAFYDVVKEISKTIRDLLSLKENVNNQNHKNTATEVIRGIDKSFGQLGDRADLVAQHLQVQSNPEKQMNILTDDLPIDVQIRKTRSELFWRFYVSRALHLSLMLISEDRPHTTIGLLLPLQQESTYLPITKIEDIHSLGESLVGWLGKSQSTQTLLVLVPSFEFSTDYRIYPLIVMERNQPQEEQPLDHTHIIVRRDSYPLTLRPPIVDTIRRLIRPIYERVEPTRDTFGPGMRDELVPTTDLNNTILHPDILLNGMTEMMVEAGGLLDQKPRWRFCCILLPNDLTLPIQNRTLIIRAQSQYSPHRVGVSSVSPNTNSLSIHAYQSGQICYRDSILPDDSVIVFHDVESQVKSAIAIPVGAEFGEPLAVIYLVSFYEGAFSQKEDRLVLRLLSRMLVEAVRTYQARRQEVERLGSILKMPDKVDEILGIFYSENNFIRDLEDFLKAFKTDQTRQKHSVSPATSSSPEAHEGNQKTQSVLHIISLIGIEVDHLSAIALQYGDIAVRNLCREIGFRLNGELKSTFVKYPGCHFYRIYGDCFYVLLKNMPYEQVLKKAVLLKKSLDGTYRVDLLRSTYSSESTSAFLHEVEIRVRLAVSSYDDQTLAELFTRYPDDNAVNSVREMINGETVKELRKGMSEGGDRIRAWDSTRRLFDRLIFE